MWLLQIVQAVAFKYLKKDRMIFAELHKLM